VQFSRNQHFFSQKQTEKMLGWIKEAGQMKTSFPWYFREMFETA
jgi:hypothetical protein